MGTGDDLASVERALEQLFRLYNRRMHSRQSAAAGVVISRPGLVLLRRLYQDGPLSLGQLATLTDMDPAATGRQVRQLEHQGWVTSEPSPEDARTTVVTITSEGRKVRQRMDDVMRRHTADVLADWSANDRRTLGRLLTRLVEGFRTMSYRSP